MNLTPAQAAALGIEAPDLNHGAKVKADSTYSAVLADGLIESVKALTQVIGVREHRFHEKRRWKWDAAWPEQKIAVELNGWTSHHRRGRMAEDFVKLAAGVLLGWRVFYATVDQFRGQAPLWVAEALSNHHTQQGEMTK